VRYFLCVLVMGFENIYVFSSDDGANFDCNILLNMNIKYPWAINVEVKN